MKLEGKTYSEVAKALADKSRDQLVDLIFELSGVERLLSSGYIAKVCGIKPREVVADMRAGRFVDPVHGRGFFVRGPNSFKVSVSAVNRWRREWFVPRELRPIPAKKNGATPEIDVLGGNARQKGAEPAPNRDLELAANQGVS
jgi:hypothetical protein